MVASRRNDQEASHYAGDIRIALSDAGWTVRQTLEDAPPEGLSIQYNYTAATAQTRNDPRTEQPDRLLTDALQSIGVRVDGGSGGGSGSVTEDVLVIRVGARRRDGDGWKPRWLPSDETR